MKNFQNFPKTKEESKSDEKCSRLEEMKILKARWGEKKIEKHWYRGKRGVKDVSFLFDESGRDIIYNQLTRISGNRDK